MKILIKKILLGILAIALHFASPSGGFAQEGDVAVPHKNIPGNPVENLNLIAAPEKDFVVIMKDGMIYKNAIE